MVTEAVLRVTILPKNIRVAVAGFPSIRAAAECVDGVVRQGIQVAAVELLDEVAMKCINEGGGTEREWVEQPTIFFKFAGTESGVKEEVATVEGIANASGNTEFIFAQDEQEAEDLWLARKTMLWGGQALKKRDDDHTWITDVAVPMSRLPDLIELTKKDLGASGLPAAIVGHVGDGNFHSKPRIICCRSVVVLTIIIACMFYGDDERSIAEGVVHRMVERAIEMEGTVTGEHGVGLVKRDYLPAEVGQSTVDAMRRVCDLSVRICVRSLTEADQASLRSPLPPEL